MPTPELIAGAQSPLASVALLILSAPLVMLIHELGHLLAARSVGVAASELSIGFGRVLVQRRLKGVRLSLRLLPLGSFVRLNGAELKSRPTHQQLLVHVGGIAANLLFFALSYGTIFGWANLLLAVSNMLPIYQHDGWKCGLVLVRKFLRRESRPVEWVYTLSGGIFTLIVADAIVKWIF